MLWFHKKSISFYIFLKLKFLCQLGHTQIHIVMSSLFKIGHHKLIPHISINGINVQVSFKGFCFHHFLELKFICQSGQTRIHIVISFLSKIWHHKLILLIGINKIDALVSEEKLFFPSFFSIKVHLSIGASTDSQSNILSFQD